MKPETPTTEAKHTPWTVYRMGDYFGIVSEGKTIITYGNSDEDLCGLITAPETAKERDELKAERNDLREIILILKEEFKTLRELNELERDHQAAEAQELKAINAQLLEALETVYEHMPDHAKSTYIDRKVNAAITSAKQQNQK